MADRKAPRKVRVGSDLSGSIITLGDNSPVVIYRGANPTFALTPLTTPPRVATDAGPTSMLAAENELVPFIGREDVLTNTMEWLTSQPLQAARLLTAAGGHGKTRLAIQLARDAESAGWQVLLARHSLDRGTLPRVEEAEPLAGPTNPYGVLLVVDYADRWSPEDLHALLGQPEATGGKVRTLLLSRSAEFWSTLALSLVRSGIEASHYPLSPISADDLGLRKRMFRVAVTTFIGELAEGLIDPDAVPVPELSSKEFEGVLALHIAALVAVLRLHRKIDRPDTIDRANDSSRRLTLEVATQELLVREVDHWEMLRLRHPSPITVSTKVMARAVLVATITRGLRADRAVSILRRLEVGNDPQTVIDQHAVPYPPSTQARVLEPLYPDRLGEDFIAALLRNPASEPSDGYSTEVLSDALTINIIAILLAEDTDPELRVPALTVLIEVARRWPHVATYLATLLEGRPELLTGCPGAVIARAANIPALTTILPSVGQSLDRIIGPRTHLTLDPGALAVQRQLVAQARNSENQDVLADRLVTLATRLWSNGHGDESVLVGEEATRLSRELVKLEYDRYLPLLAKSVSNLAADLSGVGRHDEAVLAAKEATELFRVLAKLDSDFFGASLCRSISNLAVDLNATGHREEGLRAAEEAVELSRRLVETTGVDYLPDLARSVSNLVVSLTAMERKAEALQAAEEAATLYRELAESDRDTYVADLVRSAGNLAVLLSYAGRHDDALRAAEEAVDIGRQLVVINRNAHLPNLALWLSNVSVHLSNAGRQDDALRAAEEAVAIGRQLIVINRDAHMSTLARAVSNLASDLNDADRPDEALQTCEEAVSLYRDLIEHNRSANLPDLARSMKNMAVALNKLGRRSAAREALEESVELYRELGERYPGLFTIEGSNAQSLLENLA